MSMHTFLFKKNWLADLVSIVMCFVTLAVVDIIAIYFIASAVAANRTSISIAFSVILILGNLVSGIPTINDLKDFQISRLNRRK